MNLRETLILNLKREMATRNVSQSELARRIGVAPARINELLRGLHSPTIDTIEKIATALDLPPAALLIPVSVLAEAS